MKKIFLLSLLFAMTGAVFADNVMKVAILEVVDREKKLEYGQKLILRSNLTRAVTNTEGYEAFERADIDAIMAEHDFQRTGNVSDKDIKKIGEMTGAAFVLVAEGALLNNGIYLTAKIVNVETTKVEITDNVMLKDTKPATIQSGCRTLATQMFGALAGTSTTVNKLFSGIFNKSPEQARIDSIEAAQRAQRASMEAQIKEDQRIAEERAREEKRLAEERAREEKRLALEQARLEREQAEARAREEQRIAQEQAAAAQAEREKYYITKLNNKEYEYLGSVMDKEAYANFLQGNCPAAYNQYKKGKVLIGTGWGLFGAGIALVAGGAACIIGDKIAAISSSGSGSTSYYYDSDGNYYYKAPKLMGPSYGSATPDVLFGLGVVGISVGSGLTVASIPVLCVGYVKRDNAYKVYNEKCSSPSIQKLSLNLTAGQNGLGLALNF